MFSVPNPRSAVSKDGFPSRLPKPTGAPGTSSDRSVVLARFREACQFADVSKTIAREISEWTRLDSKYPGLEHYISPPNLKKMNNGAKYFSDMYISADDHSFLITCLNELGSTSTGCTSTELVLEGLELRISFPMRELPNFGNLREEVKRLSLSFVGNRT